MKYYKFESKKRCPGVKNTGGKNINASTKLKIARTLSYYIIILLLFDFLTFLL